MSDRAYIDEFMKKTYKLNHWISPSYSHHHPSYEAWKELMPVVEAINTYTNDEGEPIYSVEIDPTFCMIRRGLRTVIVVDSPQAISYKGMIYKAVVEFAKRFHQYGSSL